MQTATDYELALACLTASNGATEHYDNLEKADQEYHDGKKAVLRSADWRSVSNSERVEQKFKEAGLAEGFKPSQFGYFAVTYCRAKGDAVETIIAHRGTCFDKKTNILADIHIAEGLPPAMLIPAQVYTSIVIENYLKKKFPQKKIYLTHTGFSLGGFIAAALGLRGDERAVVNAVTFDAPGASKFARHEGKEDRGMLIVNYVTQPNLVNTANEHVGAVRQVTGGQFTPVNPAGTSFHIQFADLGIVSVAPKKVQDINKAVSALGNTLKSHDLKGIIAAAENNGETIPFASVQKWPTANTVFGYAEQPERTPSSVEINDPLLLLASETLRHTQNHTAEQLHRFIGRQAESNPEEYKTEGLISVVHACESYAITYAAAVASPEPVESADEKHDGPSYSAHGNPNRLLRSPRSAQAQPDQQLDQSAKNFGDCLTQ